jgi:hypothetical protein
MANYFKERARGVTVQVLDFTPIYEMVIEKFKTKRPDIDTVGTYTWALAVDPAGNHYLVCDEGVGGEISDDEAYGVDLWDRTEREVKETEDGGKAFTLDMMAITTARLKLSDVREHLPVVEEVDLADFIRTFGARLEDNFWLWHDALTTKEPSHA